MPTPINPATPEILDLRHFSASQLRPLLHDEAARWDRRLLWDYTRASATLLEYLDGRILPGFAAVQSRNVLGYAFCVFEAAKAVIGDVYALHETESTTNPLCDRLLTHLLELLQSTPGIDRIESQLLMFPTGALTTPFLAAGFRPTPRLFMTRTATTNNQQPPTSNHPHLLQSWSPEFYDATAALIHRAYTGHRDADINDQYRTFAGCQRFLHNIIRFPGCGTFDPYNSFVLRNPYTLAIEAVLLTSRVRPDTAHITQLCVAPHLRTQGLGHRLLQHCLAEAPRSGIHTHSLTVTEANTPALRLYNTYGFSPLHHFEAMVWNKTEDGQQTQRL